MLYLRKKEIKDGIVYYYYQVEGKGEWGELFYDIENRKYSWIKLAEGDSADDLYWRNHAYTRIEKFIRENNFPEIAQVAWY